MEPAVNADSLAGFAAAYLTIHLGAITVEPLETLIVALALVAALICATYLWSIGSREQRHERVVALRNRRTGGQAQAGPRRPTWYRLFGAIVAASPIVGRPEQERLLRVLAAAGIKGQGNLASLVATKAFAGLMVAVLPWIFMRDFQSSTTLVIRAVASLAAFMLGWRLPDIVLGRLAASRRQRIEQGMPDALDLLVICAEAGLSLDQAIDQISRELQVSSPDVAGEFAETAAEMRVEPDASVVLDNLVRRTGVDSLRGMIATLKQSMRFGTPLAEALRVLAAEMRAARQARMEERAARLPVLLVIPLTLFILPSLFIVIGTPLALRMLDTVRSMHWGS